MRSSAPIDLASFSGSIDRSSPMPFYAQLADHLEQEIVSGRWEAGARLPGEIELCEYFGLSRSPVRQALGRLEQRGLVERLKGRGTFVRAGSAGGWLLQASEGFFQDEVDRLGHAVTSRVLRAERCTLPSQATRALELPEGTEGVVVERLRWIDDSIALYVINHLPERAGAAGLITGDPDQSLYARIRAMTGIEPAGGRRRLWGHCGRHPRRGVTRAPHRSACCIHRIRALGCEPRAI